MADQQIYTEGQVEINPDPSRREEVPEGRNPFSDDLVQAVVADQDLTNHPRSTAVLQSQAEIQRPGVSQDQTGLCDLVNTSAESQDQPSSSANKRRRPSVIHVDNVCSSPVKQARSLQEASLDDAFAAVEELESDNIFPPNSRWKASDSLSQTKNIAKGMFLEILQTLVAQNLPQSGRLKHFAPAWKLITRDPWVLQVVQGYQLKVTAPPIQQVLPRIANLASAQGTVLKQEVNDLLLKQAIHPVKPLDGDPGFISSLFVVAKKEGGNRPVVNLKPLK